MIVFMRYGRDEYKIESLDHVIIYVKLLYRCEQTTQRAFCMSV